MKVEVFQEITVAVANDDVFPEEREAREDEVEVIHKLGTVEVDGKWYAANYIQIDALEVFWPVYLSEEAQPTKEAAQTVARRNHEAARERTGRVWAGMQGMN